MNNNQANTYPKHDCTAWNLQHYVNTKHYKLSKCGICDTITSFHWRSLWRRITAIWMGEIGMRKR